MNDSTIVIAADLNPFATEWTDAIPYQFRHGNWGVHLHRLEHLGWCGAIVGPKGSGKTTLLENMAIKLQPERICRYHCFGLERARHLEDVRELLDRKVDGAVLLVDGLERASWSVRRKLLNSRHEGSGGLVVAVHKPGKLPTWIECRPDLSVLRYVIEHLGFDAASDVWHQAASVFWQFDGNVRDVLRWLYDRTAEGQVLLEST